MVIGWRGWLGAPSPFCSSIGTACWRSTVWFSCFRSHSDFYCDYSVVGWLFWICLSFFPVCFKQKAAHARGQWESTSPGVQGESRAPGAFTSFPFLPLPSSGELERPCRVGRNQSYLLPSLLAAAATDATEEKSQRFFFFLMTAASSAPNHRSVEVHSSGPGWVFFQGRKGGDG